MKKSPAGGAVLATPPEKLLDPTEKLFVGELMEMYWAEKHLVQSLPLMKQKATAREIAEAIENHLQETIQQVSNLETVFDLLGRPPQAKKCPVMEALILAGEAAAELAYDNTAARDKAIVSSARKVEHFEIACYKGLVQLATELGLEGAVKQFTDILEQEVAADDVLATIAENKNTKGKKK